MSEMQQRNYLRKPLVELLDKLILLTETTMNSSPNCSEHRHRARKPTETINSFLPSSFITPCSIFDIQFGCGR